jgi:hypothetical protein
MAFLFMTFCNAICFSLLQRILTSSMTSQVFAKGVDKDMVVLMAARASRLENQDAIDAAIVSMLADPKEVLDIYCFYTDLQCLHQHFCCFPCLQLSAKSSKIFPFVWYLLQHVGRSDSYGLLDVGH